MPHTLVEWQQYIANLPVERLGQELSLANTYTFVKTLQQEGLDMASIRHIVTLLARRAAEAGVLLPTGGAFNLEELNRVQRVAARYMSASHLEAPPAMVKKILAWATDIYINKAFPSLSPKERKEAIGILHNKTLQPQNSIDPHFSVRFPLDLSGWKYQNKVPVTPDQVVVVQTEGGTKDFAGSWEPKNWKMMLPPYQMKFTRWKTLKPFLLDVLPNIVYHECQHMAQSILDTVLKPQSGGMPSLKMRSDPRKSLNPTNLAEYFLDDAEFYPLLTTHIHQTKDVLRRYPEIDARGLVTALMQGRTLEVNDINLNNVGLYFFTLRQHAPAKYRKAVGEFVKAIL